MLLIFVYLTFKLLIERHFLRIMFLLNFSYFFLFLSIFSSIFLFFLFIFFLLVSVDEKCNHSVEYSQYFHDDWLYQLFIGCVFFCFLSSGVLFSMRIFNCCSIINIFILVLSLILEITLDYCGIDDEYFYNFFSK